MAETNSELEQLREHLTETVWRVAEAFGASRTCPGCAKVVRFIDRREDPHGRAPSCLHHAQAGLVREEFARVRRAYALEAADVCEALGTALHGPTPAGAPGPVWGMDTPQTLAAQAAREIARLGALFEETRREKLDAERQVTAAWGEVKDLREELERLRARLDAARLEGRRELAAEIHEHLERMLARSSAPQPAPNDSTAPRHA